MGGSHHIMCLACGIKSNYSNSPAVKFFKLPTNESRREIWLRNMGRSDWVAETISSDLRVCQHHFSREQWAKSKRRLKREAIPTILAEPIEINLPKRINVLEETISFPDVQNVTVDATISQTVDIKEFGHEQFTETALKPVTVDAVDVTISQIVDIKEFGHEQFTETVLNPVNATKSQTVDIKEFGHEQFTETVLKPVTIDAVDVTISQIVDIKEFGHEQFTETVLNPVTDDAVNATKSQTMDIKEFGHEQFTETSLNLATVDAVYATISQTADTEEFGHEQFTETALNQAFRLEFDEEIPEDERRFYMKVYPTVDLVSERKVHCTVCNVHIGTAPAQESIIRMHPILKVTHCKKCHDFYNSGEFSKGEDGSELYCRWCGQGGEVYCCSKCPYVFCTNCIVQNLSKDCVNDIEENENWNCFVCAPKIMWHLRAQHWALMNSIEKQKQNIVNKNFTESSIRKMMTKDRTSCCKKPKSGNISDSSCDSEMSLSRKRKSSTPLMDKKKVLQTVTVPKIENTVEAQPEPKKAKSNDVVVCTPDVLSMINQNNGNKPAEVSTGGGINEQERQRQQQQQRQLQVQQQQQQHQQQQQQQPQHQPGSGLVQPQLQIQHPSNPAAPNPAPPLIIRNLNPQFRAIAPTVVRKTLVGPRAPATTPGQSPVYHTINGFRIDLNTAAQQETFRLPNGKLIQVKRQGTTAGSVNPTTGIMTPNNTGPPVTLNSSQLIRTQLNQLQSRGIQANAHPILNQQQSHGPVQQFTLQQPHLATIRYAPSTGQALPTNTTITASAGNQGNVINHVVNGGNSIATVAIRPALQPPTVVKHIFASTPLGQARNQLQSQIFSSMDICNHLSGKIHTLTNSNAYKTARNYTDVKELYIHLSYLFTYAIGRFKTLQEKCMDDMRCLGFAGDAASLESGLLEKYASDNDDDDIVIVEPKTTLIDLDSDNDEDPSTSTKSHLKSTAVSAAAAAKPAVAIKLPTLLNKSPALPKQLLPTQLNIPAIIRPVLQASAPPPAPPPEPIAPVQEEPAPSIQDNGLAIDPMECDMDITANFLAGMLDVELYEGTGAVQIIVPPKKPRKKTTNKPNPHLIKQQQIQARERERERIKSDFKLKKSCAVWLERIEETNADAKRLLDEYMANFRVYSNKKKENQETNSNGSVNSSLRNSDEETTEADGSEHEERETINEEAGSSKAKEIAIKPSCAEETGDEKEVSVPDKSNESLPDSVEATTIAETSKESAVLSESNAGEAATQDTATTNAASDENDDIVSDTVASEQNCDDSADNNEESEQVELLEVDEAQDEDMIEPIPQAETTDSSLEESNKLDVNEENGDDGEADSTTNNVSMQLNNKSTLKDSLIAIISADNECSNSSPKSTATTE